MHMCPPFSEAEILLLQIYTYKIIYRKWLLNEFSKWWISTSENIDKIFWHSDVSLCLYRTSSIKSILNSSVCFSEKILTVLITSANRNFWHLHDLLLHLKKRLSWLVYWYMQGKSQESKSNETQEILPLTLTSKNFQWLHQNIDYTSFGGGGGISVWRNELLWNAAITCNDDKTEPWGSSLAHCLIHVWEAEHTHGSRLFVVRL